MTVVGDAVAEERRESEIQERSDTMLRAAGYDPAAICNTADLARPIRQPKRSFVSLWVLVLILPIMIAILIVLIGIFGIVVQLLVL